MYNAGGIPCQVSANDVYNAQLVGFTLPQIIYKDTDTVNINAGGLVNLSNINNLNIGNGTVSIDNRWSIGIINSGNNSKTNINNSGYIGVFNTGEKSINFAINTDTGTIKVINTGIGNHTYISSTSPQKILTSGSGQIIDLKGFNPNNIVKAVIISRSEQFPGHNGLLLIDKNNKGFYLSYYPTNAIE